MGRCHAVAVTALCLLVASATVVSGQGCATGTFSLDTDGVGNDYAKTLLPGAAGTTPCTTYMADVRVYSAHEAALGADVVVGVQYACAEDPTVFFYTLGPLASTGDATYMDFPAPAGGWPSLSGTFDGTLEAVTSIQGFGNTAGATVLAPVALSFKLYNGSVHVAEPNACHARRAQRYHTGTRSS